MAKRFFEIRDKYIFFPISNGESKKNFFLSVDGEKMYDLDLRLSETPEYITWLDVADLKGKTLCIVSDEAEEVLLSKISTGNELPVSVYGEKYRPQLHYTPMRGWVNDPNGLVFAEGKYHLFYQHNPYDVRWGNMHWGHAVSSDLVHWTEEGEALFPDKSGTMFSGCGVYDKRNISRLGTDERPPVLLYYTAAGGTNTSSAGKPYDICIAYSTDGGKTFTKYANNPVLSNFVYGNRDPKIIYHPESGKWIMVLFLYAYDFAFFSSENLLDWKFESKQSFPTMNECPDLFPLGNEGKWVLLAGADYWGDKSVGKYYIGTFDGHSFCKEGGPYLIDFGKEFYSLQTFDSEPEQRRVLIGWRTRNFHLVEQDGMPFNGEFSLPAQLFLYRLGNEFRIGRYPVREFLNAEKEIVYSETDASFDATACDQNIVKNLKGEQFIIRFRAKFESNAHLRLIVGGQIIDYCSETQTLQCFDKNVSVPLEEGILELLIVRDTVSLEIFAQKGKYPMSGYFRAYDDLLQADVYRGKVTECDLEIAKPESIWKAYRRRLGV